MNKDVLFRIIKDLQPTDLQNYCVLNKGVYEMCKEYSESISKMFLDKYSVNYKDPTNFIYTVWSNKDYLYHLSHSARKWKDYKKTKTNE